MLNKIYLGSAATLIATSVLAQAIRAEKFPSPVVPSNAKRYTTSSQVKADANLCRFSWERGTGTKITVGGPGQQHNGPVRAVHFTPDGHSLITAGQDREIRIWDINSQRLDQVIPTDSGIFSIAISSDGAWLASGNYSGSVYSWNLRSRELAYRRQAHTDVVNAVEFSPNNEVLASAGGDKTINIWEASTGDLLNNLSSRQWIEALAFSRNNPVLLEGGVGKYIGIWDWQDGYDEQQLGNYPATVNSLVAGQQNPLIAFSADGLSPGAEDSTRDIRESSNTVKVFDLSRNEEYATLAGHNDYIESLDFSPDDTQLLSGSLDGTVRLWDVSDQALIREFSLGNNAVLSVDFDSTCRQFAVGTRQGDIFIFRSNE